MTQPILTDDDLLLRAPEPDDVHAMFLLENDAEVWPHGCATGPYSLHQLKRYIETAQNDLYADRQLRLVITSVHHPECIVGMVDLIDFDPRHARAEVGVVVAPEYRQKRWASRALRLLARHCFESVGVNQLYAYITVDNTPCRALFKACGFRECANLHQWVRADKGFKDVVMVQMLNRAL